MELPCQFRKRVMTSCVCSLLLENSFDNADKVALETLSEMMQAFMTEVGQSSKNFCELSGRTEPVVGDIILALVNMGVPLKGIEQHARRPNRSVIPPLQQSQSFKQYNMLQAGKKQPHPSHVPSHLPQFPDPHAYIRTPTHKQPVTEYEAIREKAAQQKRDIEKALAKFLAKTSATHNLFDSEDNNMFQLISCKLVPRPFLNALFPQDQIFDPEDLEYEAQVEQTEQPARKRIKSDRKQSESATQSDGNEDSNIEDTQKNQEENTSNTWDIDNPYLAATKMPKAGEKIGTSKATNKILNFKYSGDDGFVSESESEED